MDDTFITYLTDQTDLFLEIDKNEADPRTVWDTYKAYMRGMIISYTRKCPGEDGFPLEFFKVMKGKINDLLLRVFNRSFEESKLPESMYRANITLIAKKNRNPDLCSSYRPISLFNVDNKILSKILALRLEKVVNSIVDADQTGFIRGRNSYHNTRRLFHIIHYLNTSKTSGAV
uniref:Reverse transcriptase domain-containing protein n=1 Tax=Acanthochromis polyacanthus TaxID=80966 RepID=A0A3Q1F1B9_9TELE